MKNASRKLIITLAAAGVTLHCHAPAPRTQPPLPVPVREPAATLTTNSAARVAALKLGAPSRLLIGLGNDVKEPEGWDPERAHAWELGPKVDIHYMYLSNLDWPEWNRPEGAYVSRMGEAAKKRGVIPMFTLYQAAAWGEKNLGAFDDATFMASYWRGVRIMFQRTSELGVPTVIHLEPDLWGYFQQTSDDPAAVKVRVTTVPECTNLPDDVAGFGRCIVRLGRKLAPRALIGFSASSFGAFDVRGASDPRRIGAYLNKIGQTEADLTIVETLDRDAGCFEVAVDPACQRRGSFYWDDAAFRTHLAWAKAIHTATGKALLWWQTPLGLPDPRAGGCPGRYRDNRVEWFFAHPNELVAAGALGMAFGVGAANQTTTKNDSGQFKHALENYLRTPSLL